VNLLVYAQLAWDVYWCMVCGVWCVLEWPYSPPL